MAIEPTVNTDDEMIADAVTAHPVPLRLRQLRWPAWRSVLWRSLVGYLDDSCSDYAAAMTYSVVTALIPLYAGGVFISFTLSQTGMVRHWTQALRTEHDPVKRRRLHRSRTINGIGATVITLGAAVKIPAALALGFLGVMIARRLGGRWKHLFLTAAPLLVIFLAVVVLIFSALT